VLSARPKEGVFGQAFFEVAQGTVDEGRIVVEVEARVISRRLKEAHLG
jgi:hypothetical protein